MYMSNQHKEALANILYGVQTDGGFIVLSGEVGTGKTTVIKLLFEKIPETLNMAFIMNPMMELKDMLATICDDFSIPYDAADHASVKRLVDKLTDYLINSHEKGYSNFLVIDEAQNLSFEVLEQLRLLTNLETDQHKLLQIVLVGQPELNDVLARPELRQLEQRIVARYHLNPLSAEDVQHYIRHRLEVAGGDHHLFSDHLIRQIYRYSGGFPRLINLLCERIMLLAYHANRQVPDQHDLIQAVQQIRALDRYKKEVFRKTALGWFVVTVLVSALILLALWMYFMQREPTSDSVSKQITESGQTAKLPATTDHSGVHPQNTDKMTANDALGDPVLVNGDGVFIATEAEHQGFLLPIDSIKTSFDQAFKPLLVSVGIHDQGDQPVCDIWLLHHWQCYRNDLTWEKLVQLRKQFVLTVAHPNGRQYYVALLGIQGDQALIGSGQYRKIIPAAQLQENWQGKVTGVFAFPEDFSKVIAYGSRGTAVNWLVRRLRAVLPDQTALHSTHDIYDQDVLRLVQYFQQQQGLKVDGVAGTQTLLQLGMFSKDLQFVSF